MSYYDILKIIGTATATVGSSAAVLIALSGWLGNLWAKRILQSEQGLITEKLDALRSEQRLVKSSFDYYKVFYSHYRLCQRAANSDSHKQPDGTITNTKDDFGSGLDRFQMDWSEREGAIRLLLPDSALECHEKATSAFNRFKRVTLVADHPENTRSERQSAFEEVERIKNEMETVLRKFLRTEKLLK